LGNGRKLDPVYVGCTLQDLLCLKHQHRLIIVPAAAVIRLVQVLFPVIGRKGYVDSFLLSMKNFPLKNGVCLILLSLSIDMKLERIIES